MFDIIVNFLHLLATAVWIGGMIYIHIVLQPALKVVDPPQAGKLFGTAAKRFSIAAWTSVVVLLITEYMKTPDGLLFDSTSEAGLVLLVKHVCVLAMIVAGLGIGFYVVPNLQKYAPEPGKQPPEGFIRSQRVLKVLSTSNLILGLLVLVLASMLW
jgi:uncharacterized membrane protein